jgi:hypothetical protein
MDKTVDGLAGALREIAEVRDSRLRKAEAIPVERLERFHSFLAGEFPVEMALRAAATHRDDSLIGDEVALPFAVHAALRERVISLPAGETPWAMLRHSLARLQTFPLHRISQAAALLAATIITTGTLYYSQATKPVPHVVNQSLSHSAVDPILLSFDRAFARSADRLTLRMNRSELASLDPSVFSINGALPVLEQQDHVLPLDLPIRQIRLDVDIVRMP